MKKTLLLLAAALLAASCASFKEPSPKKPAKRKPPAVTELDIRAFNAFYKELRRDVAAAGLNPAALDAAFDGKPGPVAAVLQSEKTQPETVRSFSDYVGALLSAQRVGQGREHLRSYHRVLENTAQRTGVPPEVIVALWGIETNFGAVQGHHPVIPALATLAWKSPRGDYFRKEVYDALRVSAKTGIAPAQLEGSWAGAMGQCQFMPSSYLAYAIDGDADNKADIWNNEADVFASAGNYLKAKGWKPNTPWRVALARAPSLDGIKVNSRGLSEPKPLREWQRRGLAAAAGVGTKGLSAGTHTRIYTPQQGGPSYLLGPNFDVILKWNNSSYFAYAVLSLADMLAAKP